MNAKIFIDTNILVYAFDSSEKEKERKRGQEKGDKQKKGTDLFNTILNLSPFLHEIETDATGRIECAFKAVLAAIPIEKKIHQAQKSGQLPKGLDETVLKQAIEKKIINNEERALIEEAEKARHLAIMVDDFTEADGK